jgi:hypothetical protein
MYSFDRNIFDTTLLTQLSNFTLFDPFHRIQALPAPVVPPAPIQTPVPTPMPSPKQTPHPTGDPPPTMTPIPSPMQKMVPTRN